MAIPLLVVGAVLKVMSTISDSNSRVGELKAAADTQDHNASILDQRAGQVLSEGARNEESSRADYRQVAGSQAAANEGAFDSSGSFLDIIRRDEAKGYLDAENVAYGAQTEAAGFRQEAANARYQSKIQRKLATRARIAGYLQAGGQAAQSFGSMAGGGMGGAAGAGAAAKGAK